MEIFSSLPKFEDAQTPESTQQIQCTFPRKQLAFCKAAVDSDRFSSERVCQTKLETFGEDSIPTLQNKANFLRYNNNKATYYHARATHFSRNYEIYKDNCLKF